jgi:hypothetical protein
MKITIFAGDQRSEMGGGSLCTTSASKGEECNIYSGANKFLARPGRKQSTATEDFDVHINCLLI